MDNFRWILLGVGIVIIVVIYLISRKNKRDFYQEDDFPTEDLPEINASKWNDFDEGVGEVRVIARSNDDSLSSMNDSPKGYSSKEYDPDDDYEEDDALMAVYRNRNEPAPEPAVEPEAELETESEPETNTSHQADESAAAAPSEAVLIFHVLAREGSTLSGKSINSVAHANDMVFGEMNIYHRLDENNVPVFSLVNMVKPGSFDPSTIHELNTPGISLFMQLPGPANASDAFTDMLQTAYRIAEILEARLCDKSRQPLTEPVVEEYRAIAASFDDTV